MTRPRTLGSQRQRPAPTGRVITEECTSDLAGDLGLDLDLEQDQIQYEN